MEMTLKQMILTITSLAELFSIKYSGCCTSVSNNDVSVTFNGHTVTVDKEENEVFNLMCEMLYINEKLNERFGRIEIKQYINKSQYWNKTA